MKLPHTHTRRNRPSRISQGKPTRHSNLQIPTTPSPNNRYDAPHTRTRMAHPNDQNLEKQPHTATHTKEDTNNQTRQLTRRKHRFHNTDHIVEGTLKTSKRERLGEGGFRLEAQAFKGIGVIEPRLDDPIAQSA
jgi:hypothetical protein